jgi:hypothetical protein
MKIGVEPERHSLSPAATRVFVLATAFGLVFGCTVGVARAHGGGPGLIYDPCLQRTGTGDFIHLAVYQPEFNPFAEYCELLPKAGSTLLVFDLMGNELPDVPVSLEVVKNGARFQLSVPPRRYRSGVVDLRADLPPGKYTVLVNVDEPDGRSRVAFPLAVGARFNGFILPITIILLIAVVTGGYCVFQIRCIASERSNTHTYERIELRRVLKA